MFTCCPLNLFIFSLYGDLMEKEFLDTPFTKWSQSWIIRVKTHVMLKFKLGLKNGDFPVRSPLAMRIHVHFVALWFGHPDHRYNEH